MKHTYKGWEIQVDGKKLVVDFEYWSGTHPTREYPGDNPEINLLKIVEGGKELPIPSLLDDGGNGEAEEIHSVLIDEISNETAKAMETIAIEPWD